MPTLKLVPVSVWLLASHSVTVNLLLSLKNQKEPLRALGRSCCMALGISSLCYMEVLRGEAWRGNCPDPFECPRWKSESSHQRLLLGRSPGDQLPQLLFIQENPISPSSLKDSFARYSIIYQFWLQQVFVAVHGLFSSCGERGLLSSCSTWASAVTGHVLGSCSLRALAVAMRPQQLGRNSLAAPQQCGILLDQGWNPCPLHQQADSYPLDHQGSPSYSILV